MSVKLKLIKKNFCRAKIPSDPFEAEMLDLAGSLLEKVNKVTDSIIF